MERPLLGAHVSSAGGLFRCFANAENVGAETIQIFGASPRQWDVKFPSEDSVSRFEKAWKESKVQTIFLHCAYLVNLASPNPSIQKNSVQCLAGHFRIANALAADGLIFHVGSGKEKPKKEAMQLVVESLKKVLSEVKGESLLIIENAAGGGQKIGATAEEIAEIMKKVHSKRVGVCFDTAHAFEAGIIPEYSAKHIKSLFDRWDTTVGCENIVAIHANDSKSAFNSHFDRHENIGKGYIGLDGFQALAKEKRLHHAAWILEVPGFDGNGPDKKNLEILRECFISTTG
jgi:deoxyribonuclease-4